MKLYDAHLPDGSVSSALPLGQLERMVEAGELAPDAQICQRGGTAWAPLPSVLDSIERTRRHTLPNRPAAVQPTNFPTSPAPSMGAGLIKAAVIFAAIGAGLILLGALLFGPLGASLGGGALTHAVILGVIGHCLK